MTDQPNTPDQKPELPLLDSLRGAAEQLPPSSIPTVTELLPLVGALVAFAQHGGEFIDAAGRGIAHVEHLLEPRKPEGYLHPDDRPEPDPRQQIATTSDNAALLDQIANLTRAVENLQADQQQQTAGPIGGAPAVDPAVEPAAPPTDPQLVADNAPSAPDPGFDPGPLEAENAQLRAQIAAMQHQQSPPTISIEPDAPDSAAGVQAEPSAGEPDSPAGPADQPGEGGPS